MKNLLLLLIFAALILSCNNDDSTGIVDNENEEIVETGTETEENGTDNETEAETETEENGTGNETEAETVTEPEEIETEEGTDSGSEGNTGDGNENPIVTDTDGDGIPNEEDTCLDCSSEDFNFSLCDEGTYAEITSTNEDGTTRVNQIPYENGIDYATLEALNCTEINAFFADAPTPTENCLSCVAIEVCENEGGENFTVTYNNTPATIPFEVGESFEDLSCEGLLARYLAHTLAN